MHGPALLDRLRAAASELGLGRIGVAAAAPSDHADALRSWLARGRAAGMTWWMERTARDSVDLRRRFPWFRSAIVVAQPYLPYDGARAEQEGILPHVARYAAGRDYHAVLEARLEALAAVLSAECPGQTHRVYVDTGAILERELAARAGLGWFGKSTNLILEGGDSWVVLGEILTSVALPAGTPVVDHCGTCTACLDECPTGAILEPYVVDANRCLSYLTIEHRGALPEEAAASFDDWLFGCDVCQEVCPWNQRVAPAADPDFAAGDALRRTTLSEVARMDETAFKERFAGTALLRARRAGVVRNALLVGARRGDDAVIETARAARADADPAVREAARQALAMARGSAPAARPRATGTPPQSAFDAPDDGVL
ncbi:MAG TPA: tRNA epoxyqueuosine(34) reductase QueG [Dongiaceae bacterium]|nr:tRNA epoxyqueuosine(34) reductase QueG [Dongiaceae bacterium]